MPTFTQSGRPLRVSSPLGEDALLLAGFRGREAVNELFAFDFHLLAPVGRPPVDFTALLGKSVTVTVTAGGRERTVNGVVAALRQAERDKNFTHLHAAVRPAWWAATLRTDSRHFQQQTVVDILKAVLAPFGPLDVKATAPYPQRDFTCQYQETDWAFACRLMEEEGVFFWFAHADGKHTLTLADSLASAPPAPLPSPLRYDADAGSPDGRAFRCSRWHKTQTIVPTAVTVWDSHFEFYKQNLQGEAAAPGQATAGEVTHKPAPPGAGTIPTYLHAGDYAKRYDGVTPGGGDQSGSLQGVFSDATRTAKLRAEAFAAQSLKIDADTNCPLLTPGQTFPLADHFDGDGKYVVLAVEHDGRFTGTFEGGATGGDLDYRNRLTAGPPDLVPRPPLVTPRPRVGGPLPAVVVGPSGQEIYVDKYGRVKVQFAWDRQGQYDPSSSCWVRVAQLWAGKGWGAFFWPRVGMEVVVHFEDGDPDRPVVTGCVYNGTNPPPLSLPAEATIAGVKSCIFGGNPATNFNALYIHDTTGVEYIQMHSERSEVHNSEQGKYHFTPGIEVNVRGRL